MKKILLICAILLALTLAFAACDTSLPTETDNGDTTMAHEEVTAAPDTADPHESDTETPTEPDTESDTFAPDGTDTQPETPTQPDTEESSPGETTPGETEPSEPEETGPGKLVFVSNDELRFLSNTGTQIGHAFDPGEYDSWTKRAITIGKDQVAVLVDYGWAAFDSRSYEFGYIVNGESFFSPGYAVSPEDAVVAAAKDKGAKNCSRFSGGLTAEVLKMGENTVQFCVKLDGDVLCVLREYTVTLTQTPVNLDGSYLSIPVEDWVISGHNPHVNDASNGMVAAGGVDKGALLHQGAVCVGEVDLSKYSKVVVYFGCDNSEVTQNHYNNNRNNRFMVTSADTNGQMSPDESIILAAETYVLPGWRVAAVEIDLANVFYKGPVYITVDALPGTFVLVSSIEFIGGEKGERPDQPDQPDEPDEPDEPDTPTPPSENQNYAPSPDDWTVSGHNPHIQDTSNGMVAAGGVEKGALLHQGAVCVGEVDLSKYSKVIVYYGCDNSQITIDHYNASANNRIMLSTVDTDGKTSPDEGDIIAAETYALRGWAVTAIEIDLTKVDYKGPVYISVDTLPGTFTLISSIEFIAGEKTEAPDGPATPPAQGNYAPPVSEWVVSGHNPHVNDSSNGMVAAGGVDKGALLHQGAVCVGEVDLSKYSKVIVYYGCDNSQVTIDRYNASANNRIMLTSVDTDGKTSPDEGDIIAAETYALRGWAVTAIEIDLTKVDYQGPVYISVDALPGTFMLISSIEFVA